MRPRENIHPFLLILAVMILAGSSGCTINAKARTVLEFNLGEKFERLGIGDVYFEGDGAFLEVVGYGWHPREHESYAFLVNESLPSYRPRMLFLSGMPGNYRIELELDGRKYVGRLNLVEQTGNSVKFPMGEVVWQGDPGWTVSGEVVAKSDPEKFERLKRLYFSEPAETD